MPMATSPVHRRVHGRVSMPPNITPHAGAPPPAVSGPWSVRCYAASNLQVATDFSNSDPMTLTAPRQAEPFTERDEREALDAYSTVVSGVAQRVLPSVASVRWSTSPGGSRGRPRGGSGSAVAITPDGYLLTAAHVVDGAQSGE